MSLSLCVGAEDSIVDDSPVNPATPPHTHDQPTQLQEQIYPMLATNFQECLPDPTKLRVVDAFVVK